MAVTPISPPVGELPSSTTPVMFSVTNLVGLAIVVDYSDDDADRPLEVVYINDANTGIGTFFYPFFATSSVDLLTNIFSVLRQGGWGSFQEREKIRIFEQPPAKTGALHVPPIPATALYALTGNDASVVLDRSGNARHLSLNTNSHVLNAPCLLPSPATAQLGPGSTLSGGPNQLLGTAADFVYGATAMTFFGVVAVNDLRVSGARTFASCQLWQSGHTDWIYQAVSDGAGGCKLRYTGPGGVAFNGTHDLPNATYETVMFRRSANGHTMRMTVGPIGNTDTSTSMPDSFTAVGGETFGVLFAGDGGSEGWRGAAVDFGFYPAEWTDAMYTTERARVLGL